MAGVELYHTDRMNTTRTGNKYLLVKKRYNNVKLQQADLYNHQSYLFFSVVLDGKICPCTVAACGGCCFLSYAV